MENVKTITNTMTSERLPLFLLGYIEHFNAQRPLDCYSKEELAEHISNIFHYVQAACGIIDE